MKMVFISSQTKMFSVLLMAAPFLVFYWIKTKEQSIKIVRGFSSPISSDKLSTCVDTKPLYKGKRLFKFCQL